MHICIPYMYTMINIVYSAICIVYSAIYHAYMYTIYVYHWCSSSLGVHMKSSKKGTSLQALRGSNLCLRHFSTSFTSLTRPTSSSSSSSSSSRAASSCSITPAILLYWHSPRCPSASSESGYQQVAHDRTEHRQLVATSAPSMLRESR